VSTILEVSNLTAGYGKIVAVDNVSFRVEAGQTVTIIGPNGAGKTTSLNAVMGLQASAGRVVFAGEDVSRMATELRLYRGLCLVPEKRELFQSMSVQDNILLGGFVRRRDIGGNKKTLASVYERFPRLAERRDQIAGTLSGGERQMLTLARALMSRPKLLMLDEPSLGLAPRIIETVFEIIRDLNDSGVAILVVEQNARAALGISDHGYVMETGSITLSGSSKELQNDPRILEAYLGARRHSPNP
jgi:branched-chain amino acid transport system ATP-binding protein